MKKTLYAILLVLLLVGCKADPMAMPKLPNKDFSTMDFFDDGYQEVELEACVDGDTAVFNINGLPVSTRFLAVDTPETNNGVDPWGPAAKEYTCNILQNAETIVLENDEESDVWDTYNRLLAWIWVDGELLQYKLVEESLAWVKYLYGDYKYNPTMIALETSVQKNDKKIWGEDDPDYNYNTDVVETTIEGLKDVNYYDKVIVTGIVTGVVGNNAFIQDGDHAVYVYTNNRPFSAFIEGPGTEVRVSATYTLYNGLNELSDIAVGDIEIVSKDNPLPEAVILELDEIGEDYEARLIKVVGVEITEIQTNDADKSFNVIVEKDGSAGVVRIDKYLNPYIEPTYFEVGQIIDVIGNIGQYQETYQIMIRTTDDIEVVE